MKKMEDYKDQIVSQMKDQGNESAANVIEGRHNVSLKYCEAKGWDMNNLSFEQIFEIRETEAWKNGDVGALE